MFLKLLKQDFRATARLMMPVYAAAILLALFNRLSLALQNGRVESHFLYVFTQLASVLFVLTMAAIVVMSFVLMIWRFHKNYMTDEGYLMFTLPVNTTELILSKLTIAIGWFICSALVAWIASLIVSHNSDMLDIFGISNVSAFQTPEGRKLLAGGAIFLLLAGICGCLMFYAAMSVGQSFRSHKTFGTVLAFFVFYIVMQILSMILLSGTLSSMAGTMEAMMESGAMINIANGLLWRYIAFEAVFAAVYYAITHWMLSRKLNLQ